MSLKKYRKYSKLGAIVASIAVIVIGSFHIPSSDLSTTMPVAYSSSIPCPLEISSSDTTCYSILITMTHEGSLTIENLASMISFSDGTNSTLFKEDYGGSSWYFSPTESLASTYPYHYFSSQVFNMSNGSIQNIDLGSYPSGSYYLIIQNILPNGFQRDVSFSLTYTVGASQNLLIDIVSLIVLPIIFLVSSIFDFDFPKRKDKVS